jgi:molybdopterin converting factor small subunit
MAIKILFFGQLTEIAGTSELIQDDNTITDINSLKEHLYISYPRLREFNFRISINGNIPNENLRLKANDEIGLLPPFAGG